MVAPARWIILVAAGSAMGLFVEDAAAADSKRAAEAKEAFERGTAYFEAEEYEAALPQFQKAYELSNRRPASIFGLAQCERALKLYEDAIVHFREYLATKPKNADEVKETLELLEQLMAQREGRPDAVKSGTRDPGVAGAKAAPASGTPEGHPKAEGADRGESVSLGAEPGAAPLTSPPSTETNTAQSAPSSVPPPASSPGPGVTPTAVTAAPSTEDEGSIVESPLFWVITGLAVVGGAVAIAVVVGSSRGDGYGGTSDVVLEY